MCQGLPAPAPALLTLLWAGRQQSHDHALPCSSCTALDGLQQQHPTSSTSCRALLCGKLSPCSTGDESAFPSIPSLAGGLLLPAPGTGAALRGWGLAAAGGLLSGYKRRGLGRLLPPAQPLTRQDACGQHHPSRRAPFAEGR